MWWITVPKGRTKCDECACAIEDAPIYFWSAKNPDEREVLCEPCGEVAAISAAPSKRYKQWHQEMRLGV